MGAIDSSRSESRSEVPETGPRASSSQRGELGDYEERFVPELHREMLLGSEHFARYIWASQLAAGRDTLDAGCGAGYGLELLLAAGAASAHGIDADPGAVGVAGERLGGDAAVVEGDLVALPYVDDSFDLITCFEVIEHVVDQDRALDELRRVLRPGGVLAISSPQRGSFPEGNPWHVHEFTEAELSAALEPRFGHVRMFGQHPHYASLIAPAELHAVAGPETELGLGTRKLAGTAPEACTYTLALAGSEPLPELPPVSILGGGADVKAMVDAYSYWERRARRAEAERDLEAMDHYRTDLFREIAMERLDAQLRAQEAPRERLSRRLRRTARRLRSLPRRLLRRLRRRPEA